MAGAGKSRTTGESVEVHVRVQSPRLAKLISGELKVEDLDDEELARGYPKDRGGKFRGRPPKMIPKELHDRMTRELLRRGQDMFRMEYQTAIEAMAKIAADPTEKSADRIKAAQYIIERVAGKVPDKVEIAAADPWQQIIDRIVVDGKGDGEELPVPKELPENPEETEDDDEDERPSLRPAAKRRVPR